METFATTLSEYIRKQTDKLIIQNPTNLICYDNRSGDNYNFAQKYRNILLGQQFQKFVKDEDFDCNIEPKINLDEQEIYQKIAQYQVNILMIAPYINQLIRHFETANLIPLPVFINGVEGHTIVRDWLTTDYEIQQRKKGIIETPSLSEDAVTVDAIVSTIGFPLVGGPAGSMEAGRQVEVAKRILSAKNIPYLIAAPLLIQDIYSWTRQGIGGLQSVVLYALPELDGAIDTIPLGGLVGETIYLIPEHSRND